MRSMKHSFGIMQGRLTPPKGRGIQFFPFDNWKQEFYDARELGLDEIEFIFDYDNFEENPLWTEAGTLELKRVMDETGVSVHAICFDYFMRRPFYKYSGDEQAKVLKENTSMMDRMLIAMRTLGVGLIEIPSVDNSSIKTEEEKDLYRGWLSETASKNPDILFGMETDFPPHEFLEFINSISLLNVGANYDSGNSSGIGYDLYEEVTTLGKHIFNIHIKDRKYKGTTMQLGTGSADFTKLFTGLHEIKYDHAFILQAARGEENDEKNNIAFQKKFVEKYLDDFGV